MIKTDQPIQRMKYLYDRLRWFSPTAELTSAMAVHSPSQHNVFSFSESTYHRLGLNKQNKTKRIYSNIMALPLGVTSNYIHTRDSEYVRSIRKRSHFETNARRRNGPYPTGEIRQAIGNILAIACRIGRREPTRDRLPDAPPRNIPVPKLQKPDDQTRPTNPEDQIPV